MAMFGNHPHIVQVFWADTSSDGRPYLVMEYYPPPHLGERAKAHPLTVQDVLRTGIQLASAVETAHRANVIHRDIKPANVLVDFYESPALTDFGIAGRGGAEADHGDVGVSVPWAPPEVLTGESNGDVTGDVYSLAATLWHLLVGRSPFAVPGGDNTQNGLTTRIKKTEPPRTGRGDVPVTLERLLARGMAKDRRIRPQSALAFARDLVAVEQELRLPPTPIRLREARGLTTVDPEPVTEDRTRIKAPTRVEAQPPAPSRGTDGGWGPPPSAYAAPTPGGAPAAYGPGGSNPSGLEDDKTVLRASGSAVGGADGIQLAPRSPRSTGDTGPHHTPRLINDQLIVAPPPPAQQADDEASGRPGWVVPTLVGAVVALAVAVVAVVVWPRDGTTTPPVSTPSRTVSTPTDDSAIGDGVFDPPRLVATAKPGAVEFTWSYAAPEKTDSFRLFVGGSAEAAQKADPQVLTKATASTTVKAGTTVCAVVQVARAGQLSPISQPECERAL